MSGLDKLILAMHVQFPAMRATPASYAAWRAKPTTVCVQRAAGLEIKQPRRRPPLFSRVGLGLFLPPAIAAARVKSCVHVAARQRFAF
ncbi:hypothetical protein CA54_02720 [Symmachiella macrocystis]|uniref:Uncharacterized protein n=1 Tax=Symmachiella macrocystis TaxID=2527985 RepID=A0A5C6BH67_9PLAN|nr:hypothetical protein CA54_02720 [Symmachiella macrocystis]